MPVWMDALSHFSHVRLIVTLLTVALQALSLWYSPGKNSGVHCHALLQGIFLTQGSSLSLLYLLRWQAVSLPQAPIKLRCQIFKPEPEHKMLTPLPLLNDRNI